MQGHLKYVTSLFSSLKITERDQNTTKKTKISEGNLVRENMKSLSNSVTKFCDQGIYEGFYFFYH